MLNRKTNHSGFATAVGVGLVGSLVLVVTVLVEAVLRMESYL